VCALTRAEAAAGWRQLDPTQLWLFLCMLLHPTRLHGCVLLTAAAAGCLARLLCWFWQQSVCMCAVSGAVVATITAAVSTPAPCLTFAAAIIISILLLRGRSSLLLICRHSRSSTCGP
jgi:hypothetical protein